VNWEEVCSLTQEGRLSMSPLREMNDASKTKWILRFVKEEEAI